MLESILSLSDKVDEITIEDNAFTESTPEYLKGTDGITVIRNASNLECAKAWNEGRRSCAF